MKYKRGDAFLKSSIIIASTSGFDNSKNSKMYKNDMAKLYRVHKELLKRKLAAIHLTIPKVLRYNHVPCMERNVRYYIES